MHPNAPKSSYPQIRHFRGSALNQYQIQGQLGEGTFGIVVKATQKASNKLVALKRLTSNDLSSGFHISSVREIAALKKFYHRNLIQLLDIIYDNDTFYLVFPYMNCDLAGVISNPNIVLRIPEIKNFMIQLLHGLKYIHYNNFLHRDVKTSNILISQNKLLKVADFGLTRKYSKTNPVPLTGVVVARWYRAPEILLGDKFYNSAIDMWAAGCIFGEFYTRKPLMQGQSDLDQLNEIFKLVGSPTNGKMPVYDRLVQEKMFNDVPANLDILDPKKLKLTSAGNMLQRFKSMDSVAYAFISRLLKLDPNKRISAEAALNHEWFKTKPLPCSREEIQFLPTRHELDIKNERIAKLQNSPNMKNSKLAKLRSENLLEIFGIENGAPKFLSNLQLIRSRSNSNNSCNRLRSNSNKSNHKLRSNSTGRKEIGSPRLESFSKFPVGNGSPSVDASNKGSMDNNLFLYDSIGTDRKFPKFTKIFSKPTGFSRRLHENKSMENLSERKTQLSGHKSIPKVTVSEPPTRNLEPPNGHPFLTFRRESNNSMEEIASFRSTVSKTSSHSKDNINEQKNSSNGLSKSTGVKNFTNIFNPQDKHPYKSIVLPPSIQPPPGPPPPVPAASAPHPYKRFFK